MREVLMSAALCIASFNWKLSRAGYPFAAPPNVHGIISEIDALVYPDRHKPHQRVRIVKHKVARPVKVQSSLPA
jgi:hypothetical protein